MIAIGSVSELLPHLLVKSCVFLKSDPLLHDHFLELLFRDLLTLDLDCGKLHIDQVLLLVFLVHFEVQVGRHSHRPCSLALFLIELLQIEDVFVPSMRRVLPRFSPET